VFFCFAVALIGVRLYAERKRQEAIEKSNIRVFTYNNEDDANLGIAAAVQNGWTVKSINSTDGHINVGRTATYTILTGGLALLLGGSRTSGKITVLFERK
jgi:hypothetical protein